MKFLVCFLWSLEIVVLQLLNVVAKKDELKLLTKLGNERLKEECYVQIWLRDVNEKLRLANNEVATASWNFETDINNDTIAKIIEVALKISKINQDIAVEARQIDKKFSYFLKKDTRRTLRLLSKFTDPTDQAVLEELENRKSELQNIYATATLEKDGKTYSLEPDLTDIFKTERNPDILQWAWKGWRDVTGKKMKHAYAEMVRLLNLGAVENGFIDFGDAWKSILFDDTPNLMEMAENLWKGVSLTYKKLHAYIRMKLRDYYAKHYPNYMFPTDGTIPAHLLGNMWAQDWQAIYDIVKPYPDVVETDVTDEMKNQNYSVQRLFSMAEEFYTSLSLDPMTDTFWKKSMFVKPAGRQVQCQPSAYDFFTAEQDRTKDDFRIKMCAEVDSKYFEIIHHEMGHIQYFMQYRHQPTIFRDGANSAFHEAVGDTISLSVLTQKHLMAVGLVPLNGGNAEDKQKRELNSLMKQALYKIAFLPFGYLIDIWRFEVFNGTINKAGYNKEWWNLRLKYQGLSSPVTRTSEDFDPGAKYHVPANSPYISYFVSFIVQFQFYDSFCKESGHTGPLHTCDYYQSKEAGAKLQKFLRLGSSKPWPEVLETLTGTNVISSDAITEYFRPLTDWLDNQIQGEVLGWDNAKINFQ